MKTTVITVILILLMCAAVTLGCMYFMDKMSFRNFLDISTFVALAVLIIGELARRGAVTGGDAVIEQSVRSISIDRNEYDNAASENVRRGLSFGWTLIISGFSWGAIAFAIYKISGN